MNTYQKFVPNVYLAKCEEKHEKGDEILVATKYGKENECIVFNLIFERDELISEINALRLPKEVKDFLTHAAGRHTVFNYERIADYYAHSDKQVQDLMEKSALVIIDFDKAIENGFVKMTRDLAESYKMEQEDDEE